MQGLPCCLSGKEPAGNAGATGDPGVIPGLGRSPEEGNDNPLHYSYLGNSIDRGAWWATVDGVCKESNMTVTERKHSLYMLWVKNFTSAYHLILKKKSTL